MKRLLLILAIALAGLLSSAEAQLSTMEQIPTVRQTVTINSGNSGALAVVSGNTQVAIYTEQSSIATPTIADSCASTWGAPVAFGSGVTSSWIWVSVAACSGTNTVTVTRSGASVEKFSFLEIAHTTGVVDVSGTGTATVSGGNITLPTVTTTHYNDLLLEVAIGNFTNTGAAQNSSYTINGIINNFTLGGFNTIYVQNRLSGNPGSIAGSVVTVSSGGSSSAQVVLALRAASALTVSTPALPDAVRGQTYSFQLGAVDGAGTNVWSITSGVLPCDLSLSSGGVISGTPTCSNGNMITFKVTDTAAANATKNLTLQVANSANTPVRIQTSNGIGGTTLTGVVAGHPLLMGVVDSINFGASLFDTPLPTDGCGTTYARLPGPYLSVGPSYYAQIYIGIGTTGGTCTVATGLSVAQVWLTEFTNLQPIFDTGVAANLNSTGGGSTITSGTLTLPTANEMLYSLGIPFTAAASISINSPFTADVSFSAASLTFSTGYETGAAAGSQTSSYAVSGNTSNNWGITLFGLRPTTTGTAPVSSVVPLGQVY